MLQPARENEREVQRETTQQPEGKSKGSGASRGCGAMRSTTNRANRRQRRVKRCQHIKMERGSVTIGNMTTSQSKQDALARKNKSGTLGATAMVEATVTTHRQWLWRTMGGGIGNDVGGTVAMMG
jgi:hypothetical protein